jgi:hypothetical protein
MAPGNRAVGSGPAIAARSPETRREIALKGAAKRTPEERRRAGLKSAETKGPEARRQASLKAAEARRRNREAAKGEAPG